MSVAFAEGRARPSGEGEVPIGAALARGGEVIASAGNRTREDADPTAHAEMLAIREAARAIGSAAVSLRLRSLRDPGAVRDVRRRDQPRTSCVASISPRQTQRAAP